MAEDPQGSSLYREQYEAAKYLFETDMDRCIEAAKRILSDRTLPPYYIIKNSILVASDLDDWNDADIFRLAAEQQWRTSCIDAKSQGDMDALEVLKRLRTELAELEEFRMDDLGISVTSKDRSDIGGIDNMGYEYRSDDEQAVGSIEDEERDAMNSPSLVTADDEVQVTKPTDLAFRPASEHADYVPITPAAAGPFLTHKQVRRQKRFFSKEAAFNAHSFSRTLSEQASSKAEASAKESVANKSTEDK